MENDFVTIIAAEWTNTTVSAPCEGAYEILSRSIEGSARTRLAAIYPLEWDNSKDKHETEIPGFVKNIAPQWTGSV